MPSITPEEWKELVLRMTSGHAELQEASARYIQVRAADEAAKKRTAEPGKLTPEWKAAGEEYAQAVLLYRQASDSLAALSLCELWPRWGEAVGKHILSLCDKWVATASARTYISRSMEQIHFAMMQMGQVAADPGRPKPADLSPAARSALEASGMRITGAASGAGASGAGRAGPSMQAASGAHAARASGLPTKPAGVSKPPVGRRPAQRRPSKAAEASPAPMPKPLLPRNISPSARLAYQSASALSSAESRAGAPVIRPMEDEPPEPARPSKAGPSAGARQPAGAKPATRRAGQRKGGR
ncbi:MAG: hypothetical protein M1530_02980 [Candidatus Marsarchaeota archaeon]|nr:hypothetical protein [Candidatus Marsarchaeota archaeon]